MSHYIHEAFASKYEIQVRKEGVFSHCNLCAQMEGDRQQNLLFKVDQEVAQGLEP